MTMSYEFPSPLGVKSPTITTTAENALTATLQVSVPSRGEESNNWEKDGQKRSKVEGFRPLSG